MSQRVAILIVHILTGYLLLNSSNSYGTAPPPSKSSYLLNEALSYHKAGEYQKAFTLCKDLLDKFNGLKVYRCADLMALYHEKGIVVAKNQQMYFKWLQYAAKYGSDISQYLLGKIYYTGAKPFLDKPDYPAAHKWLNKASWQGYSNAQYLLGEYYYRQKSIIVDEGESYRAALRQFELAAEQGHIGALLYISDIYKKGRGVAVDLVKSNSYLTTAANLGDAVAQHRLYLNYSKGVGVKRDSQKATYWLKKAAAQDYLDSCMELSQLYFKGKHVKQDKEKAIFWAEKAVSILDIPMLRENVAKIKRSIQQDSIKFTASLFEALVSDSKSSPTSATSSSNSDNCQKRALQQISDCSVSFYQEFGTGEVYNVVINCRGGRKARACERKLEWAVEVRLLDEYFAYCDLEDRDNWDVDKDKVINRICSK